MEISRILLLDNLENRPKASGDKMMHNIHIGLSDKIVAFIIDIHKLLSVA